MSRRVEGVPDRTRYRARIQSLIDQPWMHSAEGDTTPEAQAHWAKYLCVLVSGYLEQAIKEICIEYADGRSAPTVKRYIEESWPGSKNMRTDVISKILSQFSVIWASEFENWLSEQDPDRKSAINTLIRWRNDIAHGKERNTTGVTIPSMRDKFKIAKDLVDLIDHMTI